MDGYKLNLQVVPNSVWVPESAVIYLFTEEGSTVDLSKLE